MAGGVATLCLNRPDRSNAIDGAIRTRIIEVLETAATDPAVRVLVVTGSRRASCAGGVAAEIFNDTALRLLPIVRADAEAMVAELQSARLLAGWRGAMPADIAALADAIMPLAGMAWFAGERLVEADINPLLMLPKGEGVHAADGPAVLG